MMLLVVILTLFLQIRSKHVAFEVTHTLSPSDHENWVTDIVEGREPINYAEHYLRPETSEETPPSFSSRRFVQPTTSAVDIWKYAIVKPYKYSGLLAFKIGENTYVCTATVVGENTILTAGHCVCSGDSDDPQLYTDFTFIPQYRDLGDDPKYAGYFRGSAVHVLAEWHLAHVWARDAATIKLGGDLSDWHERSVASTVGDIATVRDCFSVGTDINQIGYPGRDWKGDRWGIYQSKQMVLTNSEILEHSFSSTQLWAFPSQQGPGCSGGGIFEDVSYSPDLCCITSHGWDSTDSYDWTGCVRPDSEVTNMFFD